MSDFFGDLRQGIKFPEVVMNSGPLPPSGGLPAPLHDTADARINYNSSLLGDLQPYAYGEPGYLSSQSSYLNIPHKIQKLVPVLHFPEARRGTKDTFELSHPIDDGDIAFALRLNRNSIFCTGLRNGEVKRAGLSGIVDPLINLCTVNYLLAGLQMGMDPAVPGDLWTEFMHNLDPHQFPKSGDGMRDFGADPIDLGDIIHVVRMCIRPFGITRGSEKQGGQDEASLGAATWPVGFIVSLTIDGKESNVVNVWHHHNMSAGDDLVLRLKLMPVRPYTLNHYYKRVVRKSWEESPGRLQYAWQLVPDLMHLEGLKRDELKEQELRLGTLPVALKTFPRFLDGIRYMYNVGASDDWQEFGFWHIGRSQIMTRQYGLDEYWNNDLANVLKTNHLDMTFQPTFMALPLHLAAHAPLIHKGFVHMIGTEQQDEASLAWEPTLGLEIVGGDWGEDGVCIIDANEGGVLAATEEHGLEFILDSITGGLAQRVEGETGDGVVLDSMTEGRAPLVEGDGELEFVLDSIAEGVGARVDPAAPGAPDLLRVPEEEGSTGTALAQPQLKPRPAKRRAMTTGGSLLRPDGTSESRPVTML